MSDESPTRGEDPRPGTGGRELEGAADGPPSCGGDPQAAPPGAAAGAGAPGSAGEARLLGFYDRLRERVTRAAERRGRGGKAAARLLLTIPDIFLLLVRLSVDREVPAATRAVIAATLAYFVIPTDLLPEMLVGGFGYVDDVLLATAVLAKAFGPDLERHAARHWSGSQDLRGVLGEVTDAARRLVSGRLKERVELLTSRLTGGRG